MGNTGACHLVQKACHDSTKVEHMEVQFPGQDHKQSALDTEPGLSNLADEFRGSSGRAPRTLAKPYDAARERQPSSARRSAVDKCGQSERTASTAASSTPSGDAGATAQAVVKQFVRTYVKGQQVSILSVNGARTVSAVATLDRKLTTLSIRRAGSKDGKKRDILLDTVAEIIVGKEACDEIDLALDDYCVTLLLEDGQGIAFRFPEDEDRDTFALCMSMFVDSRRGAKSTAGL